MSAANASPPATGASRLGKNAFLFIIVTVFIDMMAFAVVMPSMPYLMAELLNGEAALESARALASEGNLLPLEAMLSEAAPWGGYITMVYAVMNFLSAPILGGLSDRFGRRPVLLISIGTLAIDFLIMGFAHTIWLLFLGRVLSGISGATHSTASAYIADVTEPKQRAQAFGMLGAAFGLGFILGPAIGGFLGQFDPRYPFFASAMLAAINFCYGLFVLPESLGREHRRRFEWKRANAFGTFVHLAKVPYLAWFMLALGLFQFSYWVYPATFGYYSGVNFGWGEGLIGIALMVVGIGSAIVQGALIGPIIKRFGPTNTASSRPAASSWAPRSPASKNRWQPSAVRSTRWPAPTVQMHCSSRCAPGISDRAMRSSCPASLSSPAPKWPRSSAQAPSSSMSCPTPTTWTQPAWKLRSVQ